MAATKGSDPMGLTQNATSFRVFYCLINLPLLLPQLLLHCGRFIHCPVVVVGNLLADGFFVVTVRPAAGNEQKCKKA